MSITRIVPPIDYLRSASRPSLQSFELGRLNHAANLRREIAVLIDQWLEDTAEAMLARYMLEHHGSLREPALSVADLLRSFQEPGSDPLTQVSDPPVEIHPAPPHFSEPRTRVTGTLAAKTPKWFRAISGCVRRNKTSEWSRYFANQAWHFANRSASHALCCASSFVNYWPPRTVCPPSPIHPSLPHARQPHGSLRVLENHSTSFPSRTTRKNRGRRYRSLFPAPGD